MQDRAAGGVVEVECPVEAYKGMYLLSIISDSFLHPHTPNNNQTLPPTKTKPPQSKWVAQTAPTTPATAHRAAAAAPSKSFQAWAL
ncbi:hypothetical protein AMS68_005846 [Peltaster fructicola]|uniref:Uncharacterized protein n=1 Tax=Peltaster fructicola TaxID=286661 RepID=A0A6H0Y0E0_9PEZI|nr:hypothetical protein AMS68_005846 [Peltaster fructicola]